MRIDPDCEKLKSTFDNLGAVHSSDVDGKQLYQKILDCKMLVSSRATWNYRVVKSSWYSSNICANNADDSSMPITSLVHQGSEEFLRGSNFFNLCPMVSHYVQHIFPEERKFSRGTSPTCAPSYGPGWQLMYCKLRTIFQQWMKQVLSHIRASMTNNKSGQVLLSSFDKNRKGRKSESLLWWNHRRLCFDKGTDSVVLISIFVSFNGKKWKCLYFDRIVLFEHKWYMTCIK